MNDSAPKQETPLITRIEYLVWGLVDQQAVPDKWWEEELEVIRCELDALSASRQGEAPQGMIVVGWLDGHEFIGIPELAYKRPNAKPVYQPAPSASRSSAPAEGEKK